MTTLNANLNLFNSNAELAAEHAAHLAPELASSKCDMSVSNLADVAIGEQWIVGKIIAPQGAPEWAMQLEDIGFITGEPVTLMARGAFGGDPLVVRIGVSTFALRRAEAACVQVQAMPNLVVASAAASASVSAPAPTAA
jgi:ferrous iron transport protein A